jgi:nucleotide-binding universal stress UspA family protein
VVKQESAVEAAKEVMKTQPYESVILMGDDVGKTLVTFLETFAPHMRVIGTRENSSLERLFLGSTSSYVVENSKVPILIAK